MRSERALVLLDAAQQRSSLRQTSTRTSRNIELRNTWSSLNPTTRYKQRGSLLSLGLRSCPQRITSGRRAHPCSSNRRHLSTGRPTCAVPGPQSRLTLNKTSQLSRTVPDPDETMRIRLWAPGTWRCPSSIRYLCAPLATPFLNANLLRRCDLQAATSVTINFNRFGKLPSTTFLRRSLSRAI
jgi:hypothetical protein